MSSSFFICLDMNRAGNLTNTYNYTSVGNYIQIQPGLLVLAGFPILDLDFEDKKDRMLYFANFLCQDHLETPWKIGHKVRS